MTDASMKRFLFSGRARATCVLAITLSLGNFSAFGGSAEVNALKAQLPPGVLLQTATSAQLLAAFTLTLGNPKFDTTKKQGVVAGEALKAAGPNATDAGDVFAAAIINAGQNPNSLNPLSTILADRQNFVALAAKTAGTGSGLNVLQIPDLAAALFTGADATDTFFITTAAAAKNSAGAGAILGGRAQQINGDLNSSVLLADTALANKSLTSAAQDISRYISAEVTDTAGFTVQVANNNVKSALKIAIGAATGDPTNAGNIAHAIFNQDILLSDGSTTGASSVANSSVVSAAVKGVTTLAKSMSAGADIEEVEKIGNAIGQEIGVGAVKLTVAAGVAKTLASAIMAKPSVDSFGNSIFQNRDANKRDELAEVAAYLVSGLIGSPDLNKLTGSKANTAANDLLKIITSVTATKPNSKTGGPTQDTFAADVAGSVALTVLSAPTGTGLGQVPQDIKTAFQNLMSLESTAIKINKATSALIFQTIQGVYNQDTNITASLENGFNTAGAVSDPETDFHPFSSLSL